MERILKIVIDLLKGATYDLEAKFTQADSQSHYLQIDFKDTTLNFSGVSMKVNFIRSDGVAVTTSKASITSSNKIQIPNNALSVFGELGIEIILIKGSTILTINKLIRVNVVQTLAGKGKDLEIGDSFINEINQLTVNFAKVLSTEGDKQIERVRSAGDEVVKHIESVIGNNAEGGNAVAVGGLSRAGIETLVDNIVGKVEDGKFPLTSAEVGKVYEAVNGKKYKCITAYSGSSLSTPNANFVEMSLNNHADRLDNLSTLTLHVRSGNYNDNSMITADSIYNIDFSKYRIVQINFWGDTEFTVDFTKIKKSKDGITILSRRTSALPSLSIVGCGTINGANEVKYTKSGAYYSYIIHNSSSMCIA